MAAQIYINLDEILYRAYNIGFTADRDSQPLTQAQLRSMILTDCPLLGKSESETVRPEIAPAPAKKSKSTKAKTDEKEKKPRAPAKPRAVPDDEIRCCARAFYEAEHLENGKLKIMREDTANLYGDRCKFKKSGESDFCKNHSEKQPHGIWDGEYAGKFANKIKKTEEHDEESDSESEEEVEVKAPIKVKKSMAVKKPVKETPKETPKKSVSKKISKKVVEEFSDSETECDSDKCDSDNCSTSDEDDYYNSKLAEAGVEFDLIEFDDIDYLIDDDGNVYDAEDEKKLGVYDRKKKVWISGGIN